MTRTSTAPTKPGWYWYRPWKIARFVAVHVWREQSGLWFRYDPTALHQMDYHIPNNVHVTAEWSSERIPELPDE